MFLTNVVFPAITLPACVGLVANRLLSHDDEQIEWRSVFPLNLLVFGRYFGWTVLIAGMVYAVFLNSEWDHHDATMLGYFIVCYVITLGALVARLQTTIANRCPKCGYWGKTHSIGLRTTEGTEVEALDTAPAGVKVYPTEEYECRHCGYVRGGTFW
jgi:DNA-directed RNA polymerase subunit RPC12/RpoP